MPARVDGLQHAWPVADADFEHTKEQIAVIDLCPDVARTCRRRASSCGPAVLQHSINFIDCLGLLSNRVVFTITIAVTIASSRLRRARTARRSVTASTRALIVGLFWCPLR